ncbi:MAG: creatininase family protein [Candidatus Rokubacteria bacterium]|nr:creatininase family protein [Candidatus Rokubacteria bacterium]
MSDARVFRLEEMSMPALDALDRARTLIAVTVSPLEEHGPHLPLGVDAFTARYFAEAIADRLVRERPGFHVVLAPTLYLGSFTLDGVGTISVRQRVVRDALVDYGDSFARAGFHHILIANGHAGPTHLTALDEASAIVSRIPGVTMASLSGHLAWEFRRGHFLDRVAKALGRALTDDERRAFAEDAHGGWWETSMMLMLRPDLVDGGFRDLPPARFGFAERMVPGYHLKGEAQGYIGHPALGDAAFARATSAVLVEEAMELVNGVLDGRVRPQDRRSPFFALPFFRTNFWPAAAVTGAAVAALAWLRPRKK